MGGVFSQRLAHVANRGIHEGNGTDDKGRHGFVAVSDRPDESCVFGIHPDVVFVKGNATGLEARTEIDAGRSTRAPIEADCRRLGALACNGLRRGCRVSSTAIGVHHVDVKRLRGVMSVRVYGDLMYIPDFGCHRIQVYRKEAYELAESEIYARPKAPTLYTV